MSDLARRSIWPILTTSCHPHLIASGTKSDHHWCREVGHEYRCVSVLIGSRGGKSERNGCGSFAMDEELCLLLKPTSVHKVLQVSCIVYTTRWVECMVLQCHCLACLCISNQSHSISHLGLAVINISLRCRTCRTYTLPDSISKFLARTGSGTLLEPKNPLQPILRLFATDRGDLDHDMTGRAQLRAQY